MGSDNNDEGGQHLRFVFSLTFFHIITIFQLKSTTSMILKEPCEVYDALCMLFRI